MSWRRRIGNLLVLAAGLAALSACGCGALIGYSIGRIVDTQIPRDIPPPTCARHPLHEGQKITVVLRDRTERSGLYLWHDCAGESLLVMKPEVSPWDMPVRHLDTLRVPLRSVDHIEVPREAARRVGLLLGIAADLYIALAALSLQGLSGLD
jgi:hypothetical protein